MQKGHRIERKLDIKEFINIIKIYDKSSILITKHSLFRLNEEDKKLYKEKSKDILLNEVPILVGIQYNKSYAVFYKYNNDIIKVILDIQRNKVYIVTFYIIDNNQLPKI